VAWRKLHRDGLDVKGDIFMRLRPADRNHGPHTSVFADITFERLLKMDKGRLTTLLGLVLLVVALITIKDGLPNFQIMSDTVLWILGGILIWRFAAGGCCGRRACAPKEEATA